MPIHFGQLWSKQERNCIYTLGSYGLIFCPNENIPNTTPPLRVLKTTPKYKTMGFYLWEGVYFTFYPKLGGGNLVVQVDCHQNQPPQVGRNYFPSPLVIDWGERLDKSMLVIPSESAATVLLMWSPSVQEVGKQMMKTQCKHQTEANLHGTIGSAYRMKILSDLEFSQKKSFHATQGNGKKCSNIVNHIQHSCHQKPAVA